MSFSISNKSIGISISGQMTSGSLRMRSSRHWWYLFVYYPVHHVKLNYCHPISASLWSSVSVFIIAGLATDGYNNVPSLRNSSRFWVSVVVHGYQNWLILIFLWYMY